MEQFQLTELVEKYLKGEMTQQEKQEFEEMRKREEERALELANRS